MQKHLRGVEVKDADKGEVSAVFSTYNVVDKDGDVTLPGAIANGTEVVISAYGHGSWDGLLPVGKGVIRTTEKEAILHGQFFMSTAAGKETFATVKALGPLAEWSYSLQDVTAKTGEFEGQPVRFLEKIASIKEVSPVLEGAGINTRTLDVKGTDGRAARGVIGVEPLIGVDALRKAHAWVDPAGDPESRASYAFGHHQADGSVDLRACIRGIAQLNGAKGAPAIPEVDREGVYAHLAEHLEDADHNAPELCKSGGGLSFTAELAVALVNVESALDRAGEVLALRAGKKRGLSDESVQIVEWIKDALMKARDVLDTPHDAIAREFLRFIQEGESA